MSNKYSSSKKHIVIGKLYSNGCGYCMMMKDEWNNMIDKLVKELHLKLDTEQTSDLAEHRKYVSKDGKTIVEVIEIEDANMEQDIQYVNDHYLTAPTHIEMPNGVPMLFRIGGKSDLRYYDGERTADKMKEFYCPSKLMKRGTRRKKRQNKTKKNKTRVRYH